MKKIGSLIITFLILLCIGSCNYGLGSQIDLEAPVISVETMRSGDREVNKSAFAGGIYCNKKVSFYGTAIDNEKVEEVYTEIKWSDESDFHYFMPAKFNGTEWSIDINFEREGTAYLKFVTRDRRKNYGINSTKVITLLVDDTAPVGEAWYIDRKLNGIQYNLKEKEELEKIDLSLSENKDVAQNGNFAIKSSFNDTMGIKPGSIKIDIKDEDGSLIANVGNSVDSSSYAPVFEITEELLTEDNPELKTGKHYLQLYYSAEDIVTVPDSNKAEGVQVQGGWFLWYPESDNPQITTQPAEDDTGSINIRVNQSINLTLFDDDALTKAYCALLTEDEYNAWNKTSYENLKNIVADEEDLRYKEFSAESSTMQRDLVFPLTATSKPQKMYLVGEVTETNGKTFTIEKKVTVTDASAPILFVAAPENNSVPNVELSINNQTATFTVNGQALDTTGCSYLEFVWVPNSVATTAEAKKQVAQEILNEIAKKEEQSKYAPASGVKKTSFDNAILWSAKLGSPQDAGSDFVKQEFSFNLDLFSDFIFNEKDERNEDKYFLIKLTRNDGAVTYQEYKLAQDSNAPTIIIANPANDMQIVPTKDDFTFQFKAEKDSGMAMNTAEYKIERVDNNSRTPLAVSYNSSTGYYEAIIPAEDLKEMLKDSPVATYEFFATDLLGNKGVVNYHIVISNLPQLSSITSTSPNLCKVGDEIVFNVNFTDTVFVDNSDSEKLPHLNIAGITDKNGTAVTKAQYIGGSGTTTLSFSYTVKEGDNATKVTVNNSTKNPISANGNSSLEEGDDVFLQTLEDKNNLAGKEISIDGTFPTFEVKIPPTGEPENQLAGKTYLRKDKKIEATVTLSEDIVFADIPSFKLFDEDGKPFILDFQNGSGRELYFARTIKDSDPNGTFTYDIADCIKGIEHITDVAGNPVKTENSSITNLNFVVDTTPPSAPTIKTSGGSALGFGKTKGPVTFTVETAENDNKIVEYSTDGGFNWNVYSSEEELSDGTYQLTARATDYAGNVSDYTEIISLDLKSTFTDFTLDCTNPDGNYKAGTKLEFIVYFSEIVTVDPNSTAYIDLPGGRKANITSTEDYLVKFEYTEATTDEFDLEIATDAIHLEGITDSYGFIQKETDVLEEPYIRTITCDNVAPTVITMFPNDGDTAAKSFNGDVTNIYTTGNEIRITFSEPVQKGSGNLILRQTAGWAIPPVLTAEEYNTICAELEYEDKNILARQDENGKLEEDMEDRNQSIKTINNEYHGTGQYIGPYKKSMQGIKLENGNYVPDIDTKFVLDFDIGIWETTETHPIGKTFENHAYKAPTSTTSAGEIRAVLEKVGLHQRVLDVTSANVKVDGNVVTITFPKGLIDQTDALPDGREWELVFEKGTFLDITGNEFGEGLTKDAIQENGTQTEVSDTSTWERGRTSITDGSKPLVLIKTNGNEFFNSDKVATPVVRVDRYSYGLGIRQANEDGTLTEPIANDGVKPTGYVRVRIDCETKDATVVYSETKVEKDNNSATSENTTYWNADATSYYTTTNITSYDLPVSSYTTNSIFAVGSGDYKKSYKGIIAAKGTKTSFTSSDDGIEGVFQTVVYMSDPTYEWGNVSNANGSHVSIRGTTGFAGEPYISPFPLRDSRVGSPYLRRIFREDSAGLDTDDYYWISYEVLVESSFSNYSWHKNGYYDWARNWGLMRTGEFTRVTGMDNWG